MGFGSARAFARCGSSQTRVYLDTSRVIASLLFYPFVKKLSIGSLSILLLLNHSVQYIISSRYHRKKPIDRKQEKRKEEHDGPLTIEVFSNGGAAGTYDTSSPPTFDCATFAQPDDRAPGRRAGGAAL